MTYSVLFSPFLHNFPFLINNIEKNHYFCICLFAIKYFIMLEVISVIIPAYNSESTLESCVASVLNQTYRETEIIIVDDGSVDGTLMIGKRLSSAYDNVRVESIEHAGPSAARNTGLRLARGRYIAFVDSDDWIHPEYLATLHSLMLETGADISAVTYKIVVESSSLSLSNNASVCKRLCPLYWKADVRVYSPAEAVADLLYQKHLDSSQCCKLYRRELIEGLFFSEDCRVYEDLFFVYQAFRRSKKIVWANKRMYCYHKTADGQMDSVSPCVTDAFDVMERIRQDLSSRYPTLSRAIDNRTISVSFNILRLIAASEETCRDKRIEEQCWDNITTLRSTNFFDPNVRLKNKAGILLSLFGHRFTMMVFAIVACSRR